MNIVTYSRMKLVLPCATIRFEMAYSFPGLFMHDHQHPVCNASQNYFNATLKFGESTCEGSWQETFWRI